ncbi:MAG TPA: M23 family metallopeptidase [Sphingomonadaceae bacterium]|nr:M23 family metallopeptidase [Sphingomonadaceae bacterium]
MRVGRKSLWSVPAGLLAAAMLMGASPASAQTEATSAQISGKVTRISNGADSPLGKGDEEFSQLFANWRSLDNGSGIAVPFAANPVSVPSRMPLAQMVLTSSYGMRNHPILRQRRSHKGVDLAAPSGSPVYATADGIVARADWYGTYGNYIQIEHGGELQTRYAHLSGYAVAAGDRVQKGDLIGYVGSTGRSTGPHLHYEVRVAGEAVDPSPYLAGEISAEQLALIVDQQVMGGGED